MNGGLFAEEDIEIPRITDEIKTLLLAKASDNFNWSEISPTIFGAVFESTLNDETRRSGGMHYTSIENIHKVIDPLFLDELKEELKHIKSLKSVNAINKNVDEFQNKLASLNFLDPAAGSGNFLTETYLSLRKLENEALYFKYKNQATLATDNLQNLIKVSISQFYGIEINDFAVAVAQTALWIAESQMMAKTEELFYVQLDFLPLKTYAHIHEGNALRMDWNDVIPASELNYIMGNPPFVGQTLRTREQSDDMAFVFGKGSPETKLDYVLCWYKKALSFIQNTQIVASFVSTNSICQGESVPTFWKKFCNDGGVIQFAHTSFKWTSEASKQASVFCVIVGFSFGEKIQKKYIFNNGVGETVEHINAYLINGPDTWLNSRSKPINGLPKMQKGSEPADGGNLFFDENEFKEIVETCPAMRNYIKPFVGAKEFLEDKPGHYSRYCLWIEGDFPLEISKCSELQRRMQKIAEKRRKSTADRIRKMADFPYKFSQNRQPTVNYIRFPETSTSSRYYLPIGYSSPEIIAGNSTLIANGVEIWHFAILTSIVHMAWMRIVCGRMGMGYRYSPSVYGNFPFPMITEVQKTKLEESGKKILETRDRYNEYSLSQLYDDLTMPIELRKAHEANDKAVMEAYGFRKDMTESEIVAELMKMYQKLVSSNSSDLCENQ